MGLKEQISHAFPSDLEGQAHRAANAMTGARLSYETFSATVDGELIIIPQRLYLDAAYVSRDVDGVTAAVMSRHHDGFVREKAVERLLGEQGEWVVPFLMRLVGEYVVEIIGRIEGRFDELDHAAWRTFMVTNPKFVATTEAQVMSYWNCYHRDVPQAEYRGFQLMEKLRGLIRS